MCSSISLVHLNFTCGIYPLSSNEGLRAPADITETDQAPLPTGRNIRMPQIVDGMGEANAEAFNRDVGESSEEEDDFL